MKRYLFFIPFFLFFGCSQKETIDYGSFKSSGYKITDNSKTAHNSSDFDSLIKKYSSKYKINKKLVKAIIRKESNFNPNAVNKYSGATGLMQIKPETAGADVYQKIFQKSGKPSRSELKNPDTNIEIGVSYFTILQKYLGDIKNEKSLEYLQIASFNSGAGAVLEVFDSNRKNAVNVINSLTPNEIYHTLTTKHPREETRNYLKKVLNYKKEAQI